MHPPPVAHGSKTRFSFCRKRTTEEWARYCGGVARGQAFLRHSRLRAAAVCGEGGCPPYCQSPPRLVEALGPSEPNRTTAVSTSPLHRWIGFDVGCPSPSGAVRPPR